MSEALDMTRFIEARSDQLNADDLIGTSRTVTITRVTGCEGDQPIAVHYEGDNGKPFKPCKTIRRVLVAVWGPMANDYVGRSMTLYRDDAVTFGGLQVGGIRISHMSHLDKETVVVVAKSKGKKAGMKIQPLSAEVKPITQTKQTAEQWATEQAGAAKVAATLDSLADVIGRGARAMVKLETTKPELWAMVNAAYAEARAALEPEGDDDFAGDAA